MTTDQAILKRAAAGLLDAVAAEHPVGHQTSKASRYILTSHDGTTVEIMFEKNEKSPPNIWCLRAAAGPALIADLQPKLSQGSKLWTERGKDGELRYGRHSGLQGMPQLGEADLVCFAPETVQQIGQIIDRLLRVTASDIR